MAAEFWFNDSGTQRKSKEVYFNDGGTLRKAKEIWYNDSGTMRKVFQSGLSRVLTLTVQRLTDTARPWNKGFQFSTTNPTYYDNFLGDSRRVGLRYIKILGHKSSSGSQHYSTSYIILYFRLTTNANPIKVNNLDNLYMSTGSHKIRLEYHDGQYRFPSSISDAAERTRQIKPFVDLFDSSLTSSIALSDS
ncbi:hypothetical protein VIBNISFn27_500034 [Vibrio nigripulchritudo SFn27]|nr:hypothetical protein [Vibrio nigripulchritudo]CCN84554.1 hypothetical protein VIBNIBLFn1_80034 [Vibrio nigripulchritudo BLFn1]CCN88876.1 hypothetical protein VIBNISFn27_500034 [Vibrio nigripulchritudo SFn27]CCN94364.1 hypothetical protein VIBNIENn2_360037 [Vibrio nigripulchritudo ENn2]CCO40211.1 hypothetical protein VIBNISFn135_270034 [Vibrio nigripulchritudo SFn135]CCO51548.1 hypothetical protein VIBNIWn13_1140034 [Vibrio nigripulchritudo Wn13]